MRGAVGLLPPDRVPGIEQVFREGGEGGVQGSALLDGQAVQGPARGFRAANRPGDDAVGFAERQPLFDEKIGHVGGEDGCVDGRGHALRHRPDILQDGLCGLERAERVLDAPAEGLLIFLQVLVIG